MRPEAKARAATTKRMTTIAGARPPLPGHSRAREAELRAAFADEIRPVGVLEMTWVADVAYCAAGIEMTKAHIAGLRMAQVKKAYGQFCREEAYRVSKQKAYESAFSENDWNELDLFTAANFEANIKQTLLDHPAFCALLAKAEKSDRELLVAVQGALRTELKERDRIIEQIYRHRRHLEQDKFSRAEERRRGEAFRVGMLKRIADPRRDERSAVAEPSGHLAPALEEPASSDRQLRIEHAILAASAATEC